MNSARDAGREKEKKEKKEEGRCRCEPGTRNPNGAYNVIFGLVRLFADLTKKWSRRFFFLKSCEGQRIQII